MLSFYKWQSGKQPFPFHLLQLLLHVTNAFLLFLILRKFVSSNISIPLAIIYLVHHINTEAVVYISDLQDILFVFFGLLAVFVSMSPHISPKKINRHGDVLLHFLTAV